MKKLNEKQWGEFPFPKIFDIKKGFYNKRPEDSGDGSIPFLGATDSNNGVTRFLTMEAIEAGSKTGDANNAPLSKKVFPGGAIAVTNNGSVGHAYFQATKFTCSHDINPLYPRKQKANIDISQFLIKAVEKQGELFQYARKWRPIRMVKSKIMLPTDADGQPDYAYMEQYATSKRAELIVRYKKFVEKQLDGLEARKIPTLEEKDWVPFPISEIFTTLVGGKGNGLSNMKKQLSGANYIGATNRNNGVLCSVELNKQTRRMVQEGNCIGFIKNGDGSAGYAIYKAEKFISTSDVLYGYADWINMYTGLFFVSAQDKIKSKYSHGYKRNVKHLKRDRVMFPVNEMGQPDYAYMEQYTKNMMYKKYQQYLKFIGFDRPA